MILLQFYLQLIRIYEYWEYEHDYDLFWVVTVEYIYIFLVSTSSESVGDSSTGLHDIGQVYELIWLEALVGYSKM